MSSCLSGGRAYRLDLELIKSPSTSWTSHSSSPSSTLSESSNSPVTITTRKPRTPRKRPNQIYNEAAAILSTAYPKIFSHKQLTKPGKFTKPCSPFTYDIQDMFLPFLINPPRIEKLSIYKNSFERPCQSPGEISSNESFLDFCDEYGEDFDADSILDEDIEEGIDSIMGDITENKNNGSMEESKNGHLYTTQMMNMNTCYGYPVGMGYYGNFIGNYGYGLRREAFGNVGDQFDWRRFSSVNVNDITPEFNSITSDKKKNKTKVEKFVEVKNSGRGKSIDLIKKVAKEDENEEGEEDILPKLNAGLQLKLDYDDVLDVWSDRSIPLPDELLSSDDVQSRLAKIDLFTEDGKLREASVMRYKEKRRTRHFSKKIRYEVRKVNANQRPLMKGRFIRRLDSPNNDD